jgi:hypothetical protein
MWVHRQQCVRMGNYVRCMQRYSAATIHEQDFEPFLINYQAHYSSRVRKLLDEIPSLGLEKKDQENGGREDDDFDQPPSSIFGNAPFAIGRYILNRVIVWRWISSSDTVFIRQSIARFDQLFSSSQVTMPQLREVIHSLSRALSRLSWVLTGSWDCGTGDVWPSD